MGDCFENIVKSSFIFDLKRRTGFLEHFCLNIAFGVAYLSVLITALCLLRLFNVISVSLIVVIHCLFWVRQKITREKISTLYEKLVKVTSGIHIDTSFTNLLVTLLMGLLIFLAFYTRLISILGIYTQCQDDPKLHVLFTQLIIEHGGYVLTYAPYNPQFINYPSLGFHGFIAFFGVLSPLPLSETLVIVTMTFNALLVVFTYVLANRLFNNRWIGLFSALILGFLTDKPFGFFWGGNNFIVGLVMALTAIFIYSMDYGESNSINVKKVLIYGLLIGGSFHFHIVLPFFCLTGMFAWFLSARKIKDFYSKLRIRSKTLLLTGIISSLVASFSLLVCFLEVMYKFFHFSFFPMGFEGDLRDLDLEWTLEWSNVLPRNVILNPLANASYIGQVISRWFGDSTKSLLTFGLLLAFCYIILNHFTKRKIPFKKEGLSCSIIWCILLLLLHETNPNGLIPVYAPFSILIQKFIHCATWPLAILSAWVLFCVVDSIVVIFTKFYLTLKNLDDIGSIDMKLLPAIYGLLLIILISCSFFLFQWSNIAMQEATFRTRRLSEAMNLDSPLTANDYRLMLWIKQNTPSSIIVLVNPADAGQYIPIIAKRICVFPYSENSEGSPSYLATIEALTKDPDNSTALQYMKAYGVTHVYVGSKNILERRGFNSSLFALSNHFNLIKRVGDCMLFAVIY